MTGKEEIKRFGVSMPAKLISEFDKFIKHKGYKGRSEALRDLMREKLVVEKEWQNPDENVIGVLVLVYDREVRELSSKLMKNQHHHYKEIISTLHIHMDEKNCLEVVIIKGKVKHIKVISEEMGAIKGVKYANLIPATTAGKIL